MEENDNKCSLIQKQPQYSFEHINLGHKYNISHNNHSNMNSDPIFPFSIATTNGGGRLFPNPNNNDDTSTDDTRDDNIHHDHNNDNVVAHNNIIGSTSGVVRANNERRLKRMISNRESARRSRMRRKMQIEELQYLVGQLQTTNRQLSEKLIQLLDCNQQILQENSHLKEKVSSLQLFLSDFLVPSLRNNTNNNNNNIVSSDQDQNSSGNNGGDRLLRAQGSSTPVNTTFTSMQLLQ